MNNENIVLNEDNSLTVNIQSGCNVEDYFNLFRDILSVKGFNKHTIDEIIPEYSVFILSGIEEKENEAYT